MTEAAHQPPHQGSHGLLGLGVAEGRLRLVADDRILSRDQNATFRFRILADEDQTATSFDVVHDRRMHLIVVRRDLTGFQHLHPVMSRDGTWSADVSLSAPGSWRAFADFSIAGEPRTLGIDLAVPGDFRPEPLASPTTEIEVDGHRVSLEADVAGSHAIFRFHVSEHGAAVTLEPFLGARGHLVALRDGDLAFLHVHPTDESEGSGRVSFEATLPSSGVFRLFLQYSSGAKVRTAEFTMDS